MCEIKGTFLLWLAHLVKQTSLVGGTKVNNLWGVWIFHVAGPTLCSTRFVIQISKQKLPNDNLNNQHTINTKSRRISPNVSIETRLRSFPELFKSSLHSGTRPDIPSTRILRHWGIEASHWKSSTLAHYLQGFTRIHPRSCRISMNFQYEIGTQLPMPYQQIIACGRKPPVLPCCGIIAWESMVCSLQVLKSLAAGFISA